LVALLPGRLPSFYGLERRGHSEISAYFESHFVGYLEM